MFSDNFTYAAFAARRSSPGLAALPEDVLLVIASHLDSSADIAHLCLTVRYIAMSYSRSCVLICANWFLAVKKHI